MISGLTGLGTCLFALYVLNLSASEPLFYGVMALAVVNYSVGSTGARLSNT
jgi:hypothetical protein